MDKFCYLLQIINLGMEQYPVGSIALGKCIDNPPWPIKIVEIFDEEVKLYFVKFYNEANTAYFLEEHLTKFQVEYKQASIKDKKLKLAMKMAKKQIEGGTKMNKGLKNIVCYEQTKRQEQLKKEQADLKLVHIAKVGSDSSNRIGSKMKGSTKKQMASIIQPLAEVQRQQNEQGINHTQQLEIRNICRKQSELLSPKKKQKGKSQPKANCQQKQPASSRSSDIKGTEKTELTYKPKSQLSVVKESETKKQYSHSEIKEQEQEYHNLKIEEYSNTKSPQANNTIIYQSKYNLLAELQQFLDIYIDHSLQMGFKDVISFEEIVQFDRKHFMIGKIMQSYRLSDQDLIHSQVIQKIITALRAWIIVDSPEVSTTAQYLKDKLQDYQFRLDNTQVCEKEQKATLKKISEFHLIEKL